MKRNFLALLLVLCAMAGQAQETKNSSSAPLDSVIIEGVVVNMPDGLHLQLEREGEYEGQKKIMVKGGKLRVAVLPKSKEEIFRLFHYGSSATIYAKSGGRIKVYGDGNHAIRYWNVDSETFDQKENYAYNQFAKEHVPDYYDLTDKSSLAYEKRSDESLTEEEREKAAMEDRALQEKLKAIKPKYYAALADFMKDRPYSHRMLCEMYEMAPYFRTSGVIDKVREIIKKFPQEVMNHPYVEKMKPWITNELVKVGEQMRDYTLFDRKGKKHHLSEFKGKYTLIEFTSRFCGPCMAIKPTLESLYQKHKEKLELIAVSQDLEQFWMEDENQASYHEWNDHERGVNPSAAYGVTAIPTFVLVDPNGKVLNIGTASGGFLESFLKIIPDEELEKFIKEMHNHK